MSGTPDHARPARRQLSDVELAARIRAAGSADDAGKLCDGVVRLRQWRPDDAPAIVAGLEDGSAAHYIVGMPHPYGARDAQQFLARAEHERLTAEYAHFAVVDAESDRVLGAVGMNFRHERQTGEIGYWTGPGDRRRGSAARAVALVTRWAFEELLLPRLELIIHPLNYESQTIASRSGFRREGLLRSYLEHRGLRNDYYCFARLLDDPEPVPAPVFETTTVRGERLRLRPWRLRDAEAAQRMLEQDEQIHRWAIGVPRPVTIEAERAFIAGSVRSWHEDRAPAFMIESVDAGDAAEAGRSPASEILGSCGVRPGPGSGVADLGYVVRESARGRGVASAALQAATRWALDEGGFHTCEVLIDPANTPSMRTAGRAGYVHAGETRHCCGSAGRGGPHDVWRFPPDAAPGCGCGHR